MLKKIENKIIMIFILNSFLLMLLYLTELRINININSTFNFILIFIIGIMFLFQLLVFISEIRRKWNLKNIRIKQNIYFNLKNILWVSIGIIICCSFIYISGMQNIFLKVLILIIAIEIILDALVNAKPSSFIYSKETLEKNKNLIRVYKEKIGASGVGFVVLLYYAFPTWIFAVIPSTLLHLQNYIIWVNSIIIYLICFFIGTIPMYYLDLFLGNFVIVECICVKRQLTQYSRGKEDTCLLKNYKNKISLSFLTKSYTYSENEKIIVIMGGYSKIPFDTYRKNVTERMKIDIDMHL